MTINFRRSYSRIQYLISGYNTHMYRNALRVIFVLFLLLLSILVPVVSSGYIELGKVSTASSYIEMAEHYGSAARRMPRQK